AAKTPANVARVISRPARMVGYMCNLLCANSYLTFMSGIPDLPAGEEVFSTRHKSKSNRVARRPCGFRARAPVLLRTPELRLIPMKEPCAPDAHVIVP